MFLLNNNNKKTNIHVNNYINKNNRIKKSNTNVNTYLVEAWEYEFCKVPALEKNSETLFPSKSIGIIDLGILVGSIKCGEVNKKNKKRSTTWIDCQRYKTHKNI